MKKLIPFFFISSLYTMERAPQSSAPIIPIKSFDALNDCIIDIQGDFNSVDMDDAVLAEAIQLFVFDDTKDINLRNKIQVKLHAIRQDNKKLHDQLTFYTLYKTGKTPSYSDESENVLKKSAPEKIKQEHGLSLLMSRKYMRQLAQESYTEVVADVSHEKEREKKIYAFASGLISTIITSLTGVLITYFSVEGDCSDQT